MSAGSLRRRGLVAAIAVVLAGCPLPQPLPAIEGDVSVTPPRFVTESVFPAEGVVRVGLDCPQDAFVPFGGTIADADLDEAVEARWFVDYGAGAAGVFQNDFPLAPPDGTDSRRVLSEFRFFPSRFTATPHVIEVVVSNGFYPIGQDPVGTLQPNRTAQLGFETQMFRWIVAYEPGGRCQ